MALDGEAAVTLEMSQEAKKEHRGPHCWQVAGVAGGREELRQRQQHLLPPFPSVPPSWLPPDAHRRTAADLEFFHRFVNFVVSPFCLFLAV